ncbi:MAG: hypothetical protein JRH20_09770 [Deltaproteobacteria bacterium]|nr:hypothetical protein [Deltaproteobacteria bacterium]
MIGSSIKLPKTPGAAGCAHCHSLDAWEACPVCHRPICPRCADDPDGCPTPHAREIRLGAGGRLREVDATGCFGLTHRLLLQVCDMCTGDTFPGAFQVFLDPAVTTELPWVILPGGEELVFIPTRLPRLSRSFLKYLFVLFPGASKLPMYATGQTRYDSLHQRSRKGGQRRPPLLLDVASTRFLRISEGGRFVLIVGENERAEIVDAERWNSLGVIEVPGQPLQAGAICERAGLIALGCYGGLHAFRLDSRRPLLSRQVHPGDARWVGIAARTLACVTDSGEMDIFRQRGSRWENLQGLPPQLGASVRGPHQAALSADGRLLAVVREQRRVDLFSLPQRRLIQSLNVHRDTVHFVRFSQDASVLVTADRDGRVVVWPRSGERVEDRVARVR